MKAGVAFLTLGDTEMYCLNTFVIQEWLKLMLMAVMIMNVSGNQPGVIKSSVPRLEIISCSYTYYPRIIVSTFNLGNYPLTL
jgi:hypothetical protein